VTEAAEKPAAAGAAAIQVPWDSGNQGTSAPAETLETNSAQAAAAKEGTPQAGSAPTDATQVEAALEASLRATLEARLARVLVLGASAADGFGLGLELDGASLTWADMFVVARGQPLNAAAPLTPAGAKSQLLRHTDHLLYLDPYRNAKRSVEAALQPTPSLVIAPDILFWFVYGDRRDSERAEALEQALGLLEKLRAQGALLLLGDVPFMEQASPIMLPAAMRASEAWVQRCNQRIAAWAAERPNVALVPMQALMSQVLEGEAPAGPDWSLTADEIDELLQADGLHPSLLGTTLLFSQCMEAWLNHEAQAEPNPTTPAAPLPARQQAWRRLLSSTLELNPHRLAERLRLAVQ
jgi:hypothetical protein